MVLCLKGLKNSTRKLLELINIFIKVAVYRINIQKSITIPYTNNEYSEKENNPSHNSLKKIKIKKGLKA
jgi:hypothetical protein